MAMKQTTFRVDTETKAAAEQVCREMGITLTTAVNIFLKKLARERRIPVEVSADPFYSTENQARIRAAIADTRPPVVKTMAELEAMEDA